MSSTWATSVLAACGFWVGAQTSLLDRVVIVVLDIVGTGPGHLDRSAELLRQQCRFGDVIGFRLPAETAAQQSDMQGHLVLVDVEHLGDKRPGRLRVLGRRPDLALRSCGNSRAGYRRDGSRSP